MKPPPLAPSAVTKKASAWSPPQTGSHATVTLAVSTPHLGVVLVHERGGVDDGATVEIVVLPRRVEGVAVEARDHDAPPDLDLEGLRAVVAEAPPPPPPPPPLRAAGVAGGVVQRPHLVRRERLVVDARLVEVAAPADRPVVVATQEQARGHCVDRVVVVARVELAVEVQRDGLAVDDDAVVSPGGLSAAGRVGAGRQGRSISVSVSVGFSLISPQRHRPASSSQQPSNFWPLNPLTTTSPPLSSVSASLLVALRTSN